ncbi:hypothetical protein [Lentzea nigeriaca]|uniref:hypothetical protein n=1 Tax=Lentzea nigeriaca TaxID=1128665 RepID=UPI00195E1713|nr:hypothetical protein [Lentzea nigeriaca]MBM7856246.1 hypothetical protein [Lentzea nigeriaca]
MSRRLEVAYTNTSWPSRRVWTRLLGEHSEIMFVEVVHGLSLRVSQRGGERELLRLSDRPFVGHLKTAAYLLDQ